MGEPLAFLLGLVVGLFLGLPTFLGWLRWRTTRNTHYAVKRGADHG